jgi:hypothetical protein
MKVSFLNNPEAKCQGHWLKGNYFDVTFVKFLNGNNKTRLTDEYSY